MPRPEHPKIYHIVHVDRLESIACDGSLWSDAAMVANPKPGTVIGMNEIKRRRLYELQVSTHPGLFVGHCVPFNFCPRSVMLYVINCANHPELSYRGGQAPIIHLECDLMAALRWAVSAQRRWAFSLSNAGAFYTEFRSNVDQLSEIDWAAVATNSWSASPVQEHKQAEFLIEESFPWSLVQRVVVLSRDIAQRVTGILQSVAHRPQIEIIPAWYY
jgi:hypothetical protein